MSDTVNYFDMVNTDDLPEELVNDAGLDKAHLLKNKIITLMGMAEGSVSSPMIVVAIYRLYGEVVKKATINSTLSYLTANGEIVRVRQGEYCLPEVSDGND